MKNFEQEKENVLQRDMQNDSKRVSDFFSTSPVFSFSTENKKKSIKDVLSSPRSIAFLSAIQKADEMTEEDFEIIDMTYEHMEKQQEDLVGRENVDQLLYTLSKCYIRGCKVHTLYRDFIHYGDLVNNGYDEKPISSMPERLKRGYEVYCNYPGCLSVEIYEKHICVIENSGKSILVEE